MRIKSIILCITLFLLVTGTYSFTGVKEQDDKIVSFIVDGKTQDVKFYLKNDSGRCFKSIGNLKNWLEGKKKNVLFAMNGGMYRKDNVPVGLFIENGIIHTKLDTLSGRGNFYMKPNGVFYISTDNVGHICKTQNFKERGNIKYATQSGPMLISDGIINSAFAINSKNLNVRNGVGILPDNRIVFAMSKVGMSFYDFANYFKSMGCKNALYLDGFVSRMHLPQKNWIQTDGNFGVIIGVTKRKK